MPFSIKKENHPKLSQICSYGIFSKGLKNGFETAVVNEPSVFEPLKFYCTCKSVKVKFGISCRQTDTPTPDNIIPGRRKAALLVWFFFLVIYSRPSLSRLRLSRITAYLEEKIKSLFQLEI